MLRAGAGVFGDAGDGVVEAEGLELGVVLSFNQ